MVEKELAFFFLLEVLVFHNKQVVLDFFVVFLSLIYCQNQPIHNHFFSGRCEKFKAVFLVNIYNMRFLNTLSSLLQNNGSVMTYCAHKFNAPSHIVKDEKIRQLIKDGNKQSMDNLRKQYFIKGMQFRETHTSSPKGGSPCQSKGKMYLCCMPLVKSVEERKI